MSSTPRRLLALTVLTATLAVAACTSTVDGSGKPAPRASASPSGPPGLPSGALATSSSSSPNPPSPPSPTVSSVPTDGARFTDPAQVAAIEIDATRDLEAVNSYSYRDLPGALRRGLMHVAGSYTSEYRRAFSSVVVPAARRLHASQAATVNAIAVGRAIGASSVPALVVVQTTVRRVGAAPRVGVQTVSVNLREVGGVWLLSDVRTAAGVSGTPAGTPGLAVAAQAASRGVTDVLSLRRAEFAADYQRALAATTGSLHTELAGAEARTRRTLIAGKYDLSVRVEGNAAVSASGRTAVFLVAADGYRSTAPNLPTKQTLLATMNEVGTTWRLSDVESVGVR